ncbi:MAG: hypothetical protein IT555_02840 [Acetobacteraceae bacterium]|nr:hypothetical protein [Acetobacteraceae bacterium]
MPTPLREAALAAIADRLTTELSGTVLERARRAPVDTDKEVLPCLVLTGTDWEADETAEPGSTHYTMGFVVVGYVRDTTDLGVEQGLSHLHASVVTALAGWTPTAAGLGEAAEQGAEFRLYDTDESAKPAGEFTARFSMLAIAPLGSPYLP